MLSQSENHWPKFNFLIVWNLRFLAQVRITDLSSSGKKIQKHWFLTSVRISDSSSSEKKLKNIVSLMQHLIQ